MGREKETKGIIARFNHLYERNLRGLLERRKKRLVFFGIILGLFIASFLLIPLKLVIVKMLPFDNKRELQVVVDMPEGTNLEETAALIRNIGDYVGTVPEVTDYQSYIGTSGPFNFNGLVRHYYLRSGGNVADIQVNFLPKDERRAQSHNIAKRMRPEIQKIGALYNAKVKVVEIPPGPPVLSTLVAEVYGPDFQRQIEIASDIRGIFEGRRVWSTWTGMWRQIRRRLLLMLTEQKPH